MIDPSRAARLDPSDLRKLLVDPRDVCRHLGLDDGARPQARGLLIRCPWHAERSPSCSVRTADDGTIAVHCFGCGEGGDVLDLIAVAHSLKISRDFPEVIRRAAEMAGIAIPAGFATAQRNKRAPSRRQEVQRWPSSEEVSQLWSRCRGVSDAPEVGSWLRDRALDPVRIEDGDLARAIPTDLVVPRWARFQRRPWPAQGYRCVVPMFDHGGLLRSVRARSVTVGDGPKALPPSGHSVAGLVMADLLGRTILRTGRRPELWPDFVRLRIIVTEGEPDFLTWATAFSEADLTAPAVLGVVAGSWTPDIADRIPDGSRVIVRTDHDAVGEKYACEIRETLGSRCLVLRGAADGCALCPDFGWTGALQ